MSTRKKLPSKTRRAPAAARPVPSPKNSAEWEALAQSELSRLIRRARGIPLVDRLGPKGALRWSVQVSLIGSPAMIRLNGKYRGKHYATDVLSFPAPTQFLQAGLLGELILCLPTMKRQAREQGHAPEQELRVLLAHGLLHLLGLDHERSPRAARVMAKLEEALLKKGSAGLIARGAR